MIEILDLAFGSGLINVLVVLLRLIDTKLNIPKYVMRICPDTFCVFRILSRIMPGTPGMQMAVFAVLDLDDY